ncbi:MAG: metallophosphoesterase [Rickettsiales bacterium]
MKIITYSDLHLEFGTDFLPPTDSDADVMILAGDIITFRDYAPLEKFLAGWQKPVLFVAGNHEFYTRRPMLPDTEQFKDWLAKTHPHVTFLQDEAVTLDGVHFFGGTMWTDFSGGNAKAMLEARTQMNDYRQIRQSDDLALTPEHTVELHETFAEKLAAWFTEPLSGARVVISHHAPVVNPNTKYGSSLLMPAFNSLDMIEVIDTHHPVLWVYGHTHECDDHMRGNTRIISNQLGYPSGGGGYECRGFDPSGKSIVI